MVFMIKLLQLIKSGRRTLPFQNLWIGMVLFLYHYEWLQPIYYNLETMLNDEGQRCERHLKWSLYQAQYKWKKTSQIIIWQWVFRYFKWISVLSWKQKYTTVRERPLHPQTQSKIEQYHKYMKNVVKLANYFIPWELEEKLKEFVHY